ncbi:hypothetical protein D3C87_1840540 [compost metagenome]
MEQRERLQPLLIELLFRQSYAVLFANFVIPLPVADVLKARVARILAIGDVSSGACKTAAD